MGQTKGQEVGTPRCRTHHRARGRLTRKKPEILRNLKLRTAHRGQDSVKTMFFEEKTNTPFWKKSASKSKMKLTAPKKKQNNWRSTDPNDDTARGKRGTSRLRRRWETLVNTDERMRSFISHVTHTTMQTQCPLQSQGHFYGEPRSTYFSTRSPNSFHSNSTTSRGSN